MHELLMRWIPWGLAVVAGIQSSASGEADGLWRAITDLGSQYAYIALLAVLLWSARRRLTWRLALLLVGAAYLNVLLKDVFEIERPFILSEEIVAKASARSYAFPSGHAQLATVFWLGVVYTWRKLWLVPLASLAIVLVGFSRIYLGVHYPQDILGGMAIGLLWTSLYFLALPHVENWPTRTRRLSLACAALLAGALALLAASRDALLVVALSAIAALAWHLEERAVGYRPRPGRWLALARLALGFAVVGAVYGLILGLGLLLAPATGAPEWARYLGVGLAITPLAPILFSKLGLAQTGEPAS